MGAVNIPEGLVWELEIFLRSLFGSCQYSWRAGLGTGNIPEEFMWELAIFIRGWFGSWKYSWGVYVGAGNIHKGLVWELAIFLRSLFGSWQYSWRAGLEPEHYIEFFGTWQYHSVTYLMNKILFKYLEMYLNIKIYICLLLVSS